MKQTYMYNNVKLVPISTIEPIVPQNDIQGQNILIYTVNMVCTVHTYQRACIYKVCQYVCNRC